MKSYYIVDEATVDLDRIIIDLDGYWKFQSILYLKKLGLPVLDGIIATRWNDEVHSAIINFCRHNGWDALLLRHDKKPERPPYPMGGYLVPLEEIQKEASKYFEIGRILFLLEPCSSFDNSYNINALFENDHGLLLEIVGPGFDAGDLQRGYMTPHEMIQIDRTMLKTGIPASQSTFEQIIKRTILANQRSYENSVRQRYLKIAKRLKDLGKTSFGEQETREDDLITMAKKYLQDNGYPVLSLNETNYTPIPIDYFYEICSHIYNLPERLQHYVNHGLPFVVSSSYVKKGTKLVFWDIVWPKLKYSL
ncbi:hypothetical protein MUP77_12220 [Candidatus Bathyarchaeota archaeon]|nr:hypothetical protein [Candidatus Bathyarchaeota archaeon]